MIKYNSTITKDCQNEGTMSEYHLSVVLCFTQPLPWSYISLRRKLGKRSAFLDNCYLHVSCLCFLYRKTLQLVKKRIVQHALKKKNKKETSSKRSSSSSSSSDESKKKVKKSKNHLNTKSQGRQALVRPLPAPPHVSKTGDGAVNLSGYLP